MYIPNLLQPFMIKGVAMLLTVVSLLFSRPYRLRGRLKMGFQTVSVYKKDGLRGAGRLKNIRVR